MAVTTYGTLSATGVEHLGELLNILYPYLRVRINGTKLEQGPHTLTLEEITTLLKAKSIELEPVISNISRFIFLIGQ